MIMPERELDVFEYIETTPFGRAVEEFIEELLPDDDDADEAEALIENLFNIN